MLDEAKCRKVDTYVCACVCLCVCVNECKREYACR